MMKAALDAMPDYASGSLLSGFTNSVCGAMAIPEDRLTTECNSPMALTMLDAPEASDTI